MNFGFKESLESTQVKTSISDDTYLLELSQFQFPSVPIDQLMKEPYLSYVELYKDMYRSLKFYRGFIRPNSVKRAKIYRSLKFCCNDEIAMKDIIVFTTVEGLIIKCRYADDNSFSEKFNYYMAQEDSYVFIPEKCDKLDKYNYTYYRRMLNNFILNEKIPGKTFRMNEHDNVFLFISLENPCVCSHKSNECEGCYQFGIHGNSTLEKKWKEYTQGGGVLRTHVISPNKIISGLKVFPWMNRDKFRLLSDNQIEITLKSPSLNDFEKRLKVLESEPQTELKYIELDFTIADEYEAFGILRILQGKVDLSQIIPLIGTSRIYLPFTISTDILMILNEYKPNNHVLEGSEIFSQDDFAEMSKWRQASLIKAPSGNLYSFLDLYQNLTSDPLTREPFTDEFKNNVDKMMQEVSSIFMFGFPPMKFEPELITIASEPNALIKTISFYIKIGEETNAFWIIPDLRDTEFNKITLEAIRTLIIKWSDHSLFKNSFSYTNIIPDDDIHLLFSPIALYVFEQNISNLTIETYPRDVKSQARHLLDQVCLLKRCS